MTERLVDTVHSIELPRDTAGLRPVPARERLRETAPAHLQRVAQRRWAAALRALPPAPELDPEPFLALLDDPDPYCAIADARRDHLEKGLAAYHAPYLRWAAGRIAAIVESAEAGGLAGAAGTAVSILGALGKRLHWAAQQTAALLLNVARVRGELAGDTPEERSLAFSQLLLNRDYRRTCGARFPKLDDILLAMTEDAVAAFAEFFDRLAVDRDALTAILPDGLGALTRLEFYAGDPHNGGRSVVLVHGSGGSVVYKPRSLDTDAVLGRAIGWLDTHLGLGMAHFPILRRGDYGWTAFIVQRDCADLDEVRLCYERCGALLGLLFLLGGADIHHENLICSGAQPFIVDAEALLNGPLTGPTAALRQMQRARIETVINTCYLPSLMPIGDGFIDVSAAGYRAGQSLEFKRLISDEARDDLEAKPMIVPSAASGNVPTLAGEPQPAEDHLDRLEHGFRAALETMIAHRAEFISREDLMPAFASAKSRFIPRATAQYGRITRNALHPHACADAAKHDHALSALASQMLWCEPVARAVLAADAAAIRRGDVPFFKGAANSRSIWTSSGEEIPRVFQETGHDSIVRRVKRLDRREIDAQIDAIRLTFSLSSFVPGAGPGRPQAREAAPREDDLRLATATALGDRLIDRAIVTRGHIHWLGRTSVGERFAAALVGPGLYGGIGGIGIFFAELARKTGAERHRRTALLCLETMRAADHMAASGIGAFDGMSGCVYADLVMSRALGVAHSPKLRAVLAKVPGLVGGDRMFDLIGGASGGLLVALRAASVPDLAETAEAAAHACARHLLDHAAEMEHGIAWRSPAFETPLTGLAHGSCGIGMALGEYAAVFGDEEAWDTMSKAFDYAAASFDAEIGLWRDLRSEKGAMIAWCHGAAGMVLARQRIAELAPGRLGASARADIATGLDAMLRQPGPRADSICHGRGGNWEPLWRGEPRHRALADLEAARLCADWHQGMPLGGDMTEPTPDLMNGLAGVGLQLLRSLDPETPCVALLEI
jgi:type 2 lantibiotic biosynthesis protein LanM